MLKNDENKQHLLAAKAKPVNINCAGYSLRLKIPLIVFILTVLIALIVGVSYYYQSKKLLISEELQGMKKEAKLVNYQLERLFEHAKNDVVFLLKTPSVNTIAEATIANNARSAKFWKQQLKTIAVDLVRERRFNLILMDCQMPEMDGYAAHCYSRI